MTKPGLPDTEALNRLATSLPLSAAMGRLRVKALASGAELILFGTVGDEITAAGVFAILATVDQAAPLTVRINSPGGSVFEALAIYNALSRRPGATTLVVEGVAASAASLIAMAGREIVMGAGTFLMIHDPSGLAAGTAGTMRELAEFLDQVRDAMVPIYATRSGQSETAIRRMMDAETWFTAEEAVAQGFADRVEAGRQITASFDLSRFQQVPAGAPRADAPSRPQSLKDPTMSTSPATVADLKSIAAHAKLPLDWVLDQVEASATVEAARDAAVDAMAARSVQRPTVAFGGFPPDRVPAVTAMEAALISRVRGTAAEGQAREYASTPMAEMARELLEIKGENARRWSVNKVVAAALHTTSDFPALLQRVTQATLLAAYQAAQSPLVTPLARTFTSSNGSRDVKVTRAPEFPVLLEIIEHEEIKHGTAADGSEGFRIKTFARMFGLTEDAIRQDTLGGFASMVDSTGRAAAETEARELVAVLTANAGAGVKLFDGLPLFDASRGNVGTGALSIAGLSTARQAMRRTKNVNGDALAPTTPKYLLVSPDLETAAEQFLSQLAATTPDGVNVFAGRLTLLVEPRLSGASWYIFADPAAAPVLGVAYFDNEPGVRTDTKAGWDVLGVETRAVLDFGAGAIGWRGAYRSTGV